MKDLWDRFERWCAERGAGSLALRPPAKASDIDAAEKTMGLAFPADFKASLLVHDGQDDHDGDGYFRWMPGCDRLAPLAAIVAQWKDEQDRVQDNELDEAEVTEDGRFRNVLWHSKRIPIAGSRWWDGDNTYLDLVPGPKGASGQLVTMTSECDFVVLGASFRDAFERYVNALEDGSWANVEVSGHSAEAFAAFKEKETAASSGARKPRGRGVGDHGPRQRAAG